MSDRKVTQSIESDDPPESLLEILQHPENIPRWAPRFADTVEKDAGPTYTATKNGNAFRLRASVDLATCSVDYLREIAPGKEGGAFIRVLPRPGGGSVVVMTLPIPPTATRDSVSGILSEELSKLVELARRGLSETVA